MSLENEPNSEEEGPYRILLVDDENEALVALQRILSRTKLFRSIISVARNSREAFEELERESFDLVISDYRMPGMDGVTFLKTVREKYPTTARILLTGHSDVDLIKAAINRAHVHNYIEKPWDTEELAEVVHEALKNIRKERETFISNVCKEDESNGKEKEEEKPTSMMEILLSYDP